MKSKNEQPIIIIRKRRGHAAHHGGAWKVAFADFMTAMFALFLVLWLVNQSSDVKSAIAGYFSDPLGRANEFGSSIVPGDGAQTQTVRKVMVSEDVVDASRDRLRGVAKSIEERFGNTPELASVGDHIEITLTDEGLRIELIEDSTGCFFERGGSTLNSKGQQILELLGKELGALTLPVRIEGHTDAYRFHDANPYSNWELSADRANAARRTLLKGGLGPDQITQVRAFADRSLRVQDDPYSPKNRRITIMMLLNTALGSAEGDANAEATEGDAQAEATEAGAASQEAEVSAAPETAETGP